MSGPIAYVLPAHVTRRGPRHAWYVLTIDQTTAQPRNIGRMVDMWAWYHAPQDVRDSGGVGVEFSPRHGTVLVHKLEDITSILEARGYQVVPWEAIATE